MYSGALNWHFDYSFTQHALASAYHRQRASGAPHAVAEAEAVQRIIGRAALTVAVHMRLGDIGGTTHPKYGGSPVPLGLRQNLRRDEGP